MKRSKVMASISAGLFTVLAASACGAAGGHAAQVGTRTVPSSSSQVPATSTTPPTTSAASSPFGANTGGAPSGSGGSSTSPSTGPAATTPTTSPSQSAAATASLNAVQQDLNGIDAASNQAASDLSAGQSAQAQNDSP